MSSTVSSSDININSASNTERQSLLRHRVENNASNGNQISNAHSQSLPLRIQADTGRANFRQPINYNNSNQELMRCPESLRHTICQECCTRGAWNGADGYNYWPTVRTAIATLSGVAVGLADQYLFGHQPAYSIFLGSITTTIVNNRLP